MKFKFRGMGLPTTEQIQIYHMVQLTLISVEPRTGSQVLLGEISTLTIPDFAISRNTLPRGHIGITSSRVLSLESIFVAEVKLY